MVSTTKSASNSQPDTVILPAFTICVTFSNFSNGMDTKSTFSCGSNPNNGCSANPAEIKECVEPELNIVNVE